MGLIPREHTYKMYTFKEVYYKKKNLLNIWTVVYLYIEIKMIINANHFP